MFGDKFAFISLMLLSYVILNGDGRRSGLKEGVKPERRDYRPTKWVPNSAMDVWYGNKSMIDVIFREFADVMYKLTSRPLRSTSEGNDSLKEKSGNVTWPMTENVTDTSSTGPAFFIRHVNDTTLKISFM